MKYRVKETAVEWLWVQAYNTIPFQSIEASQIFNGLLHQAKEMEKEQREELETCLRHCLLLLVQTKAHREAFILKGGDIFLDSTIEEIKKQLDL